MNVVVFSSFRHVRYSSPVIHRPLCRPGVNPLRESTDIIKVRSSVVDPVVIPPEYDNDATRGKDRPVIDVNSDPFEKFARWIQRVFVRRLLPLVLVLCCLFAASTVYHQQAARELNSRPLTTISILKSVPEENPISPFVEIQVDEDSKSIIGLYWNKNDGHIITKHHYIKDKTALTLKSTEEGDLGLSILAIDEDKDIAILQLNQEKDESIAQVDVEEQFGVGEVEEGVVVVGEEERESIIEELDKERALAFFLDGVTKQEIEELIITKKNIS